MNGMENNSGMRSRQDEMKAFMSSEKAISTVVSAVLLFGILVSVITLVYVQYIPEWKTSAEKSHMDDVFYDMAEMKNELDLLSGYARTEPSTSLSVSVPVKMGGGSLPIFSPGKSSGRLTINEGDFGLSIVGTTPGVDYDSDSFLLDLGTVSYRSDNAYYVNQNYVYEGGALILAQNSFSLMRLGPQMDIRKMDNSSNITVEFNLVDLNGQRKSISSNSIEEVNFRTNGSDSLYWDGVLFTDMTMTLHTSYPASWESYFELMADDAGIDSSEYSVSSNDTAVVFFLEGSAGEDIHINVTKTYFDARLNLLS
ncbi:hypothetical protein [Methanolobus bombayensis]|uniref:hypothetical protein n=1 Tax=Methanolobus bombayensis TaxID=38023 RepID=UPI001AE1031F|nr:hypothetical protein [Methanolobus bombayensis]MBP1908617.1 hypothetical protein [Methanolobus bombayensis]